MSGELKKVLHELSHTVEPYRIAYEMNQDKKATTKESKEEKNQGELKDAKEPGTIEMMQVTLKIPKACLMYLNEYMRTEAWLENRLVESVRAEYEVRSLGTWKADEIGLSPVFWQLLKDKRYHPDPDIRNAAIEGITA